VIATIYAQWGNTAKALMSWSDSLKRRGAGPIRAPILTARTIPRSDTHAGRRLWSSARRTWTDRELILCGVSWGLARGLLIFLLRLFLRLSNEKELRLPFHYRPDASTAVGPRTLLQVTNDAT
jgi:hypothetical protein